MQISEEHLPIMGLALIKGFVSNESEAEAATVA